MLLRGGRPSVKILEALYNSLWTVHMNYDSTNVSQSAESFSTAAPVKLEGRKQSSLWSSSKGLVFICQKNLQLMRRFLAKQPASRDCLEQLQATKHPPGVSAVILLISGLHAHGR